MNSYRQIQPLLIAENKLDYNHVELFQAELRSVNPSDLYVDESYQRALTKKSTNLIKKIVAQWQWQAFKPPIVTEQNGVLLVIDGQHTSIAAATHPKIHRIPVFVVANSYAEDTKAQAEAFVRHNVDRTVVNPIQLFKARLEAGDDDAIAVNMALTGAGVTISQSANIDHDRVGKTSALGTIEKIYNRRGVKALRELLQICVRAKLEPIQAHYLEALDGLLYHKQYRNKFDHDGLALTIREYPYAQLASDIELQARQEHKQRKVVAIELVKNKYETLFDLKIE